VRHVARRLWLTAGVVIGALALMAAPASAHALPQSSDPAAGARLATAPTAVTIVFGETPDPRLSLIRVLDSSGTNHATGKTVAVPGNPNALEVHVGALSNGVYTVAWRTVSEVDGHLASGTFAFGVGVAPGNASLTGGFSTKSPRPTSGSVASRWLLYAGFMGLVGGVYVALFCYESLPRRARPLLGTAWVVAAAGVAGITVDARAKAGLAWGSLLGSSLGEQLKWRAIPLVVAGALLAAAWMTREKARRRLLALAGIAALAAMWGDVEASHASAAKSLRLLRMADQWAHFAAAGIWVGGLVTLLVTIGTVRGDRRLTAAIRYSLTALIAVGVVAATGFQRAYDEVGSWHALFHTGFGQSVAVKIVLLGGLVCLGAYNRYRSVPRVNASLRRLGSAAIGELILMAAVLVATGIIQGLAPSTSLAAAPAVHPLVLTGNDAGTTVKARLTISPGMVGFNTFSLSAADYDTGAPVAGSASLNFNLPARPDLGASSLSLPQAKPGLFVGQGANLALTGDWSVTATIQKATGGVEIPFTVTPRTPPEKIVVQPGGSGLPTTYTLQLPNGQGVQTYLDPGHPGFNEFHVTFLTTTSQEIQMSALTVRVIAPHQTPSAPLTVRRLDNIGHFVADFPGATKGTYQFDVSGTTPTGSVIAGTFSIPVT